MRSRAPDRCCTARRGPLDSSRPVSSVEIPGMITPPSAGDMALCIGDSKSRSSPFVPPEQAQGRPRQSGALALCGSLTCSRTQKCLLAGVSRRACAEPQGGPQDLLIWPRALLEGLRLVRAKP